MYRQKEILLVFNGDTDKILKKSEIKEIGQISYYYNTDKHLGETLSRMVKNNNLIRVSRGKFKLGSGKRQSKLIIQPKNQTKMF